MTERVTLTKWDTIGPAERRALDRTPFIGHDGQPGKCSYCEHPLPTEGEFARHFTVTDRRYPNLGECPVKLRDGHTPMQFA